MTHKPPKDYEVGYGKPPKNRRFGQENGNPINKVGRKRIPRTLEEAFAADLQEKVAVRVNGKTKVMTKLEAITKGITQAMLKGNPSLIRIGISISKNIKEPVEFEVLPDDEIALQAFENKGRYFQKPNNDDGGDDEK